VLEELTEFIQSNLAPRELKRAITVPMQLQGYKQREIQEFLSVSSGFISKWTQIFTYAEAYLLSCLLIKVLWDI
jgi:hypothetical protein